MQVKPGLKHSIICYAAVLAGATDLLFPVENDEFLLHRIKVLLKKAHLPGEHWGKKRDIVSKSMKVLKQPIPIECLFTEWPNQRMHPQNRCYLKICRRSETPIRTIGQQIGKKEQEDISTHCSPQRASREDLGYDS